MEMVKMRFDNKPVLIFHTWHEVNLFSISSMMSVIQAFNNGTSISKSKQTGQQVY